MQARSEQVIREPEREREDPIQRLARAPRAHVRPVDRLLVAEQRDVDDLQQRIDVVMDEAVTDERDQLVRWRESEEVAVTGRESPPRRDPRLEIAGQDSLDEVPVDLHLAAVDPVDELIAGDGDRRVPVLPERGDDPGR